MANRILFLNTVGTNILNQPMKEYLEEGKQSETEVDVVSLPRGPLHVEYHYYRALALMDTLHSVKQAEKDGYDATVIGCFCDIGLREAKEITERMVVVAPGETCMSLAGLLGYKFSIIVGRDKWIPWFHDNVVKYGFKDRLASFKTINMGVHDFHEDEAETANRMRAAGKEAVEKDRAEVIILGCTATFGFYRELQEFLGVPVLDPIIGAFKYAEFLIELKRKFHWMHSKKGDYETPPLDEIKEWNLEGTYGAKGLWFHA